MDELPPFFFWLWRSVAYQTVWMDGWMVWRWMEMDEYEYEYEGGIEREEVSE